VLKNISIQTKLLSALALILVISLISGGFNVVSVQFAHQAVQNVEQISTLKNHVLELEDEVTNTHRYMTSFLNSGDLERRELYRQSAEKVLPLFDEVTEHTDDENVLQVVSALKKDFTLWQETIASRQINYMRSPDTVDMARLLESSHENDRLWRQIDTEFNDISNRLEELSDTQAQNLNQIMNKTSIASIAGVTLTIIATVLAGIFIVYVISRPLQKLVEATNALVQKQWDTDISGTDRGDEIGQMAQALLLFRDNGVENEKLMAAQKEEDEKRLERANNIEKIVESFRQESSEVTMALEDATQKMSSSSVTMSNIANETNQLSEGVSKSAQSAGNNVNNVSAATEELTASIQEISQQLTSTNKMALEAKDISNNTVEKMKVLENSASEINSVIEIISDIAEQTNLLALNATIEAARAGDAGKGFAVVASEVKTLANETAKATEQVQSQIDRIQNDTTEAVSFIEKISKSIESLTENMATIASAMEEQTSATQEISRNVSEASQGTNTVVQNITDVSDATRKTQETSQNVSDISEELKDRSETLKQSISTFIDSIKSA